MNEQTTQKEDAYKIATEFIDEHLAANSPNNVTSGEEHIVRRDLLGDGYVQRDDLPSNYNPGPNAINGYITNYSPNKNSNGESNIHTFSGDRVVKSASTHRSPSGVKVAYKGMSQDSNPDQDIGRSTNTASVVRAQLDPISGAVTTYKHEFKAPDAADKITALAIKRIEKANTTGKQSQKEAA